MKKSLLALAALTAFAGVASAQSSVTVFGVVDLNARSTKTGSTTLKTLSQDGNASSRLGFRGVEDLGGGMRAGFWLEAGHSPDTGVAGGSNGFATAFFNRRATVSLLGGFGEVRLGRDYTPTFWNYTVFDPFGTNGVGSHSAILSTLGSTAVTLVRDNNTIGYFLPAMGGVYGQVQAAPSEGLQGEKYVGGRLGYAGGPVNVAGAFGKTYKTGTMLADYKDVNFGASYNLGFLTLMGQYSKRDYSKADQKTVMLGTNIAVGAGTIKLSFAKSSGDNKNPAVAVLKAYDVTKIAGGYVHDLSKRTAVYAHLAKENRPAVTGVQTESSADVTAYEFGIRHSF